MTTRPDKKMGTAAIRLQMLEDEMGVWMLHLHYTRLQLEADLGGTSSTGTSTPAPSSSAPGAGAKSSSGPRSPESRPSAMNADKDARSHLTNDGGDTDGQ